MRPGHWAYSSACSALRYVCVVLLWQRVNLGPHDIDTWYFSPYPAPPGAAEHLTADILYICEFNLKYFRKEKTLRRHLSSDVPTHPPGQPDDNPCLPPSTSQCPPVAQASLPGLVAKKVCHLARGRSHRLQAWKDLLRW